ncbi:hypothetical protein ACJQWK_02044 [Exserohilum turcicum]
MLAFCWVWAALVFPALAALGWGGECRIQSDCCFCDPGSGCLLTCFPDHTSTTGRRCKAGGASDCGIEPCNC